MRDLLQPKRDGGSPGEPRQRTALGLDLTGGWKLAALGNARTGA